MFVYSKNSRGKVFHNQQCPYARRISFAKLRKAHTQEQALDEGYMRCKCCGCIEDQYRIEKEGIDSLCRTHYLRVEFVGGEMYVISRVSVWKIVMLSKRKIKLLHQNGYNRRKPAGSRTPLSKMLFHEQHEYAKSVARLIEYISQHDGWRVEERQARQPVNSYHGHHTKQQKKDRAKGKKQKRRRHIRGVLDTIDHLAVCSGDFSAGHICDC